MTTGWSAAGEPAVCAQPELTLGPKTAMVNMIRVNRLLLPLMLPSEISELGGSLYSIRAGANRRATATRNFQKRRIFLTGFFALMQTLVTDNGASREKSAAGSALLNIK
jgi:hypothetical protein